MCVYGSKFFGWRLSVKNSRMLIFAIAGFLKEPMLFSSFRKSTHKWRIQSMQKYISVVFIEIIVGKGENYQGQWCSFSTETSYVFSMYQLQSLQHGDNLLQTSSSFHLWWCSFSCSSQASYTSEKNPRVASNRSSVARLGTRQLSNKTKQIANCGIGTTWGEEGAYFSLFCHN